MKKLTLTALLGTVTLLVGCAHPITMSPKLDQVNNVQARKSPKVVGYYISEQDRALAVTTPGGGGDKVTYKPYADLEYGLDRVLSKKYAAVYAMEDPQDSAFIAEKKISYVFHPKLTTDSRSDSMLTWPPTSFTVVMDCVAHNHKGAEVWKKTLRSEGKAEFSEFKHNFALSAERASTGVLIELQKALDHARELQ